MYLSSKLWFLAAVKETETSEELFISLVGLIFFLGLRSACIASAYGLGYTTDLPMASEKKVQPRKKKFFYGFVLLQAKK